MPARSDRTIRGQILWTADLIGDSRGSSTAQPLPTDSLLHHGAARFRYPPSAKGTRLVRVIFNSTWSAMMGV